MVLLAFDHKGVHAAVFALLKESQVTHAVNLVRGHLLQELLAFFLIVQASVPGESFHRAVEDILARRRATSFGLHQHSRTIAGDNGCALSHRHLGYSPTVAFDRESEGFAKLLHFIGNGLSTALDLANDDDLDLFHENLIERL